MGMGRKPTKDKGPRLFILINPVIFIVYCMCYLKFFGEKVKVGVGGKIVKVFKKKNVLPTLHCTEVMGGE